MGGNLISTNITFRFKDFFIFPGSFQTMKLESDYLLSDEHVRLEACPMTVTKYKSLACMRQLLL